MDHLAANIVTITDLILACGYVLVCAVLFIGIPLGLLYFLVRFVKWAWVN